MMVMMNMMDLMMAKEMTMTMTATNKAKGAEKIASLKINKETKQNNKTNKKIIATEATEVASTNNNRINDHTERCRYTAILSQWC